MKNFSLLLVLLSIVLAVCQTNNPVKTGLDNLDAYQTLFTGKRLGIVTNHTGYNSEKQFIADVFQEMENVKVVALYGPEHGIRGKAQAGASVEADFDEILQIPVFSLYGKTHKPTAEMLQDVDILVFDIQDVGARFYTYISTMALAMEAAAEREIPFVVLDRPNPINGMGVEGNILDTTYASFVGMFPIPVRHGMTVGELARMFNDEGWLRDGIRAELTVIPMKNWYRKQWYDQTGLEFVAPSPNMPDLATATVYPGLCLIEGTNVSEGRGTELPFLIFGAPWYEAQKLSEQLNSLNLPGISFKDTTFTPVSIPGKSENPKLKDRSCSGAKVIITNRDTFKPYYSGIHIVNTLFKMNPDSFQWRTRSIQVLSGTDVIREVISAQGDLDSLVASWQDELENFMEIRKKYLLYE